MGDKLSKLDLINKILVGLIIGAGCLAVVMIALRYQAPGNSPGSSPELIPPPGSSATAVPVPAPDRQPTEAHKGAALPTHPPEEDSAGRGGVAEHLLADLDRAIAWRYHLGEQFQGAPVVRADGSVVVAGVGSTVYAIDPGGDLLWSRALASGTSHDAALSPVTVGRDSAVYLTAGPRLVALSAAGELRWEYTVDSGRLTAPAVAGNGDVLIKNLLHGNGGRGDILAISPLGELKWKYQAYQGDQAEYELADTLLLPGVDGRVFDLGRTGSLVSFSRRGERGWGLGMNDDARGPVLDRAGVLHLVSQPDPGWGKPWLALALIPQSGGYEEKWHYELPGPPVCDPVAGADERVYFACQAGPNAGGQPGPVYAFNRSGEIDWRLDLSSVAELIPPAAPDGVMCVLTDRGAVVVSPNGAILFSLDTAVGQPAPRVIGTDGIIYCEQTGDLVAIDARLVPAD